VNVVRVWLLLGETAYRSSMGEHWTLTRPCEELCEKRAGIWKDVGKTHVLVTLAAGGDVAAASIGDGDVDTDDCFVR
jgi:hypothetical protein